VIVKVYLLAQPEPSMRDNNRVARLTSIIEPETHNNTRRVDIAPPKQLKAELNLGEIRMHIGIRAGRLYVAVTNAICLGIMLTLCSLCTSKTKMDHLRIS
jgi:hypothetical protein